MKVLFLLLMISCSLGLRADEWRSMYVGIASSGPGGSALGHSFFLFCKEDNLRFNLKTCQVVEYNLDINLGEKYLKTKNLDFIDKIEAFNSASFKIYKHDNPINFQKKYFDRDQSLTYYQYRGTQEKTQALYNNIERERLQRDVQDKKDYSIMDNNCATKIVDAIARIEGSEFNLFKNQDFYDIDQYLFNFPIYLQDSIEASGLFPHAIEFSKDGWRSFGV